MQHHFLSHTNRHLLDLKTHFQLTLKTPSCEMIQTPVADTIKQIDAELELRGIGNIKKQKQIA